MTSLESSTRSTRSVVDIDDADQLSPELIGVKGWYLARLRASCFDTPPGFIVPASVYTESAVSSRVAPRLERIWETARHAERSEIPALSRTARHLIAEVRIDGTTVRQIDELVDSFGRDEAFAVRSSATPGAVTGPECAGVYATFTGVVGVDAIVSKIHRCWSSLFGEWALTMRSRGLGNDPPAMAVIVQKLVPASKSGIVVPIGPSSEVLIEATFGLGEPIVSGTIEPDRYVVDRSDTTRSSVTVGHKHILLPPGPEQGHAYAPASVEVKRVLDDDEVHRILRVSARVDRQFGGPHEVEWALADDTLSVLQIRPVAPPSDRPHPSIAGMVCGLGVGLGCSTGHVHLVRHERDLRQLVDGDVLVATSTDPRWRPHMERAGAIVTDDGDEHCHAARLARELGIPAVVGTSTATTALAEGSPVTVDASRGWILPNPAG
jgi:pyruvate,water dikinase